MNMIERVWLAAVIDSEGSISLVKRKRAELAIEAYKALSRGRPYYQMTKKLELLFIQMKKENHRGRW